MLMAMLPLARTPMDKKSGQEMQKYQKALDRQFDQMLPWKKRSQPLRERLRGKVKSGEVAVILGATDSRSSPLFKDAKIIKEA